MATIVFSNGKKVKFNGDPTPEDIEEVANQLGFNKPAQSGLVNVQGGNVGSTAPINLSNKKAETVENKGTLRKVADFFTGAEQSLGKTFGAAASVISPEVNKNRNAVLEQSRRQSDNYLNLAKQEKDKAKKQKLLEAAKKSADIEGVDIFTNPEYQKTAKEIAGEFGQVALDIASAGTYGQAAKGARAGQLLTKKAITKSLAEIPTKQIIKEAVKTGAKQGAIFGAGYGATQAMREDKGARDIVKDTIVGGITNALLGAGTGYLVGKSDLKARNGYEQKAKDLIVKATDQYRQGILVSKQKYYEMQDKIIPELLKEKTWGTWKTLVKKADDGIALSGEEYKKLGELKGITDITPLIKNIDDRMKGLTSEGGKVLSVNESKYNQLLKLKDDILSVKRGEFVAGAKGISTDTAKSQSLREIAQQYGEALYDSRKAQQTVEDSKTLSQIKRVDGAIRELLNTENPEYAKINKVYTFSTNLKDVLLESEKSAKGKIYGGIDMLKRIGQIVAGATVGGYATNPQTAILGATAALSYSVIKSSTWYNTLSAVNKQKLAEKILAKEGVKFSQTLNLLARQGIKYADELINE